MLRKIPFMMAVRYFGDEKKYLSRVEQLLNEGADIIRYRCNVNPSECH